MSIDVKDVLAAKAAAGKRVNTRLTVLLLPIGLLLSFSLLLCFFGCCLHSIIFV